MASATTLTGLSLDRCRVDRFLSDLLAEEIRVTGAVREAMQYAVLGGGQRIRPILTLRVARLVGAPVTLALRGAAAVELLHCASLIIDDLPCMDDSALRRNQPSVHVKFGEATAILAAFGLVALAARKLVDEDCAPLFRERVIEFQIQLLKSLDCSGLIAGQALDLRLADNYKRSATFVPELKTAPLFTLAVSAGFLFADLGVNERALLKGFGRDFGLAFQMADDLLDGDHASCSVFEEMLTTLRAGIAAFGAARLELEELVDYLHARVAAYQK